MNARLLAIATMRRENILRMQNVASTNADAAYPSNSMITIAVQASAETSLRPARFGFNWPASVLIDVTLPLMQKLMSTRHAPSVGRIKPVNARTSRKESSMTKPCMKAGASLVAKPFRHILQLWDVYQP